MEITFNLYVFSYTNFEIFQNFWLRRKFYINRSLILKGIFIMYIVNFSVCANINGVSSTSALANCNYLSDCSGLECCIDSAYILGNRSIYFQIKVDCANIEYQIETKSVSKSLTALTDGKLSVLWNTWY